MLRKPHLASESTVHVATTTVKTSYTALRSITIPRLACVLEPHRLSVVGSYLHLKIIGKLAAEATEGATRKAEQINPTHDVLQCVIEGHVEAILGVAGVGVGGTLVLLKLRDMHTAPAGGEALCEMGRAVGGLGTSKGAKREGGDGEEGGDCAAHLGRL